MCADSCVAAGGNRLGEKGFFVEPTVFSDVTDDMVRLCSACEQALSSPLTVVMHCRPSPRRRSSAPCSAS